MPFPKLHRLLFRSQLQTGPEELYAYHMRVGALRRLVPPWERLRLVGEEKPLRPGAVRWLLVGPGVPWRAVHDQFREDRQFRDRQSLGPFLRWEHTHRFLPGGWLEDDILFRSPLPGHWLVGQFERMFAFRHRRTRLDLENRIASRRILISGATGFLGTELTEFLRARGHQVARLVRRPTGDPQDILWDPYQQTVQRSRLEGFDCVIHLSGRSIFGPWSDAHKQEVWRSRVDTTRFLVEELNALLRPPATLMVASGVGYYGTRGGPFRESAPAGEDYLARLCQAWEAQAQHFQGRVVNLRIGIVLGSAGGALAQMLVPWKLGLGAVPGSGRQRVPWIGLEDTLRLLENMVDRPWSGPFNLVAPHTVSFRELADTLARLLGRPRVLRVPGAAVRLALREAASAVLEGPDVESQRLSDFSFCAPTLEQALGLELGRLEAVAPPGFSGQYS